MPPPSRHEAVTGPSAEALGRARGTTLPRPWPSKRTRARLRRWGARALLLLPGVGIVLADLSLRHERLAQLDALGKLGYLASASLGAVLWSALVATSARRRGVIRWITLALLLVGAGLAMGGQIYTFGRYQAYLNDRSVLVGTSMMPSIGQQLWFDRATFLRSILPPLAGALILVYACRRLAPTRKRRAYLALDLGVLALLVIAFRPPKSGEQDATFDVLYVNGMGWLLRARWDHNECVERVHPGPRSPIPLPALVVKPPVPRNVLFVLTESVRAQSTCVAYDEHCVWTPFSNRAAPHRIALNQMRSPDSTTAISLAVMWTGLAPTDSRADLHSFPLIYEYARAAGMDTAYWTSQNLLFGNSGAWLEGVPFGHHINATQIEEDPTLEMGADDGKLIAYVKNALGDLKEPFFSVVHLSNTHFPYMIDEELSPFLPESGASGPGYEVEIKNRYQDSIYLQDRAVAELINAVRARPESERTIIMFLSDHGEQMREKGAVGHTGTLYEPEIRIPLWFDAPAGTLTATEEAGLRALADTPLTTLDIMPTLLDLIGAWDAPEVSPFRARMLGQSLLRGGSTPDRVVFMTNCSQLWACAFRNWGAIKGTMKLIANQGDHDWNCFDVANDPDELDNLGPEACGDLQGLVEARLGGRPF
jgi:glucan phosphoethanolaminetransferase (alkaline phosphatase superfamily)